MPTAAKLIAALCLAALGYATSEVIKTTLPTSTVFGVFSYVNAGIGLVMGWIVVGNRAGRGMSAALSNGFTGTVGLVFWGLFVQGGNEMTRLALRNKYDGMFEAILAIFQNMVVYAEMMLDAKIILTLLCGAIITGFLSELGARYWR